MSNFVLVPQLVDPKGLIATAVRLHKPPGVPLRTRVLSRLFEDQLVRPGYVKPRPFASLKPRTGGPARDLLSYQLTNEDQAVGHNYWSHVYGGGGALMQKLIEDPELVSGKNVLDLGAGGGSASIAATFSNAKRVEAWDADTMSVVAITENAKLNNIDIKARQRSVMAPWPDDIDVVMAGDVIKRPFLSAHELAIVDMRIQQLRMRGGTAIIADSRLAYSVPQYADQPCALPRAVLKAQELGHAKGWGLVVLGPIG